MTPTPQDAEAVAQAREALVRVLQAAHISCEPSTFYDLAETLGVTFPPTEHQIADALFAAVRVEGARDALTRFVKERREGTASDDQWDMLCDLERFRDREYPAPTERKGAQECPCGRVRQLCGTVGCSNPANRPALPADVQAVVEKVQPLAEYEGGTRLAYMDTEEAVMLAADLRTLLAHLQRQDAP